MFKKIQEALPAGYELKLQKQYPHRDDAHLYSVVAVKKADGREQWTAWLYNSNTNSLNHGRYCETDKEGAIKHYRERLGCIPFSNMSYILYKYSNGVITLAGRASGETTDHRVDINARDISGDVYGDGELYELSEFTDIIKRRYMVGEDM